jgi:hypothetical protein
LHKNNNKLLRLAGSGLQMGIIIALASFTGDYLDDLNDNVKPIYTIIGSLFGVTAGLYLLYRNVIKK